MNTVAVDFQLKRYALLGRKIRKTARIALNALGKEKTLVEFFLVSDADMRKIHNATRGKNKATNVLSFAESESGKFFKKKSVFKKLGEIYIAPDFVRMRGQSVDLMVVHGILHLCGYDHMTKKDAEKMEKKEAKILRTCE